MPELDLEQIDIPALASVVEQLTAQADQVRALHIVKDYPTGAGDYFSACSECHYETDDPEDDPCPTIRALDGKEATDSDSRHPRNALDGEETLDDN